MERCWVFPGYAVVGSDCPIYASILELQELDASAASK